MYILCIYYQFNSQDVILKLQVKSSSQNALFLQDLFLLCKLLVSSASWTNILRQSFRVLFTAEEIRELDVQ